MNPDKGLISLFAIAVSHEIRGNVVKKNWTLITGEIAHVQAPIFVTIVAPIKPFLSPPLLFVCLFVSLSLFLAKQDRDGNWSPPSPELFWS